MRSQIEIAKAGDEMRIVLFTVVIALLAGAARADLANDISACRAETDTLKRLVCYDAITVKTAPVDPAPKQTAGQSPVTASKIELRYQPKDTDNWVFNSRVEAYPSFVNNSDKTVVAIGLKLTIKDAFGENVVNARGTLDMIIPPGETVESPSYYSWDDNPFSGDDPFDDLVGPVKTGVAKASIVVTDVVYDDGTIESYQ
ncbi:hypothetical protein [Martelella sp. AD-3]|uniref:hypothetical protein n=2 Tax=Martelella sp. AD-3 TaxID=686597 RepID=UPI001AECD173|nr:hypothetical protein [Martelella sp. AD-3]